MMSRSERKKMRKDMTETIEEFAKRIREQKKTVTVIIDETGNFGGNFLEFPIFCVGATLIEKPTELSSIAVFWRGKKAELKYRKTNRDKRVKIESELSEACTVVIGVYYEKRSVLNWKRLVRNQNRLHQNMIIELADDLTNLKIDFDKIIIDDCNSLRDKQGNDIGAEIIRKWFKSMDTLIYVGQEDSEIGEHKDIMQAADFAIGAMGRRLCNWEPETSIVFKARKLAYKPKK